MPCFWVGSFDEFEIHGLLLKLLYSKGPFPRRVHPRPLMTAGELSAVQMQTCKGSRCSHRLLFRAMPCSTFVGFNTLYKSEAFWVQIYMFCCAGLEHGTLDPTAATCKADISLIWVSVV